MSLGDAGPGFRRGGRTPGAPRGDDLLTIYHDVGARARRQRGRPHSFRGPGLGHTDGSSRSSATRSGESPPRSCRPAGATRRLRPGAEPKHGLGVDRLAVRAMDLLKQRGHPHLVEHADLGCSSSRHRCRGRLARRARTRSATRSVVPSPRNMFEPGQYASAAAALGEERALAFIEPAAVHRDHLRPYRPAARRSRATDAVPVGAGSRRLGSAPRRSGCATARLASRAQPAPASIIAGVAPCWLCGAGWIVTR